MATIITYKPKKTYQNSKSENKYDRYALERIERKLNKLTDLMYSLLRR